MVPGMTRAISSSTLRAISPGRRRTTDERA
jgi:hypothetical protein